MSYGRCDDLKGILREIQKREYLAGSLRATSSGKTRVPRLGTLATAAANFADGLVTARVPHLLTQLAGSLTDALDEARPDVESHLPLVLDQFDELKAWCAPIVSKEVSSRDGLRAAMELASLYRRLQRYSEWSALLAEAAATAHSVATRKTPLQPGKPGYWDEHMEDDRALGVAAGPLGEVRRRLRDVRNDIQHAGHRDGPLSPKDALRGVVHLDAMVRKSIEQALAAAQSPSEPAAGVFINCSNHPSNKWSNEQREAALALGSSIEDVPFPDVPPAADVSRALAMARKLAADVMALNPAAAFVAGELSVATPVIVQLQSKGIPCMAGTTQRVVTEQAADDGKVIKTAVFKFVSWRRIPDYNQMVTGDDVA
jgi:hypothetical protein